MGFPQASGVVGGAAAAGPSFAFYQDSYGSSLDTASFSDAMPAALRCVRELCGGTADDGLEAARAAALSELASAGLASSGAGRP